MLSPSQRWMIFAGTLVAALLVYLLAPILMPFLVAGLLAYLGDPVVDWLETWHLPRTAAVCLVFVALVLVLAGLVLLLIPLIGDQIESLRRTLPEMFAWVRQTVLPWIEQEFHVDIGAYLNLKGMAETITEHWRQTGSVATVVLQQVTSSGLALIGWLTNLALIPVVAFYLLRDWDRVIAHIRDLLPRFIEPTTTRLAHECNEVLGAFLRGQLLVMFGLGAIYAFGLWLVGLDLALLIGLVAGIASIVPYLGTIVGIGAALIATLFQFGDAWHLIAVAIVFGLGQAMEGMVLTPLLVGDRIGLHPVAVIFAVLAGGQLFGFAGVLLALPIASVIMVLLRYANARYKSSHLYDTAN